MFVELGVDTCMCFSNHQSRFFVAKRYMLTLISEAQTLVLHLHCVVKLLDITAPTMCSTVCAVKYDISNCDVNVVNVFC